MGCNPTYRLATKLRAGFSTLYGSKWVATSDLKLRNSSQNKFQYPLRVEVGCNRNIGSSACRSFGFQYPLRVEVGCNGKGGASNARTPDVSVPSTGRSGLQPAPPPPARPRRTSFSTLYGSKWVATTTPSRYSYCLRGFSTLYGSKWVATLWRRTHTTAPTAVSVPSTGRSGLQQSNAQGGLAYGNGFQYPLRVEVGCNNGVAPHSAIPHASFSTLYGSKWVATLRSWA